MRRIERAAVGAECQRARDNFGRVVTESLKSALLDNGIGNV